MERGKRNEVQSLKYEVRSKDAALEKFSAYESFSTDEISHLKLLFPEIDAFDLCMGDSLNFKRNKEVAVSGNDI